MRDYHFTLQLRRGDGFQLEWVAASDDEHAAALAELRLLSDVSFASVGFEAYRRCHLSPDAPGRYDKGRGGPDSQTEQDENEGTLQSLMSGERGPSPCSRCLTSLGALSNGALAPWPAK